MGLLLKIERRGRREREVDRVNENGVFRVESDTFAKGSKEEAAWFEDGGKKGGTTVHGREGELERLFVAINIERLKWFCCRNRLAGFERTRADEE